MRRREGKLVASCPANEVRETWVEWTITDLGDSGILLPLAALVLAGLVVAGGGGRAIGGWMLAVGACGLTMAVLKVALIGCGSRLGVPAGFNPSGHSAMAATVWGGLGRLAGYRLAGGRRWLAWSVALALVAAIAVTRLTLAVHTPGEVAAGLTVGALALTLIRPPSPALALRRLVPALVAAIVVVLALHGNRLPAEDSLHRLAGRLDQAVPACQASPSAPVD